MEIENKWYHNAPKKRLQKALAQYELYKKIVDMPGSVVEVGVFKACSLIRWATYRDCLESAYSRKIIGFDTFDTFPEVPDDNFPEEFTLAAGKPYSTQALHGIFKRKEITNYELVAGDIFKSIPKYLSLHPELVISLLHIDVDVYEPTKEALKTLLPHVIPGGLIVLDDYTHIPGATKAVTQFIAENKHLVVKKLPISHSPSFIDNI